MVYVIWNSKIKYKTIGVRNGKSFYVVHNLGTIDCDFGYLKFIDTKTGNKFEGSIDFLCNLGYTGTWNVVPEFIVPLLCKLGSNYADYLVSGFVHTYVKNDILYYSDIFEDDDLKLTHLTDEEYRSYSKYGFWRQGMLNKEDGL